MTKERQMFGHFQEAHVALVLRIAFLLSLLALVPRNLSAEAHREPEKQIQSFWNFLKQSTNDTIDVFYQYKELRPITSKSKQTISNTIVAYRGRVEGDSWFRVTITNSIWGNDPEGNGMVAGFNGTAYYQLAGDRSSISILPTNGINLFKSSVGPMAYALSIRRQINRVAKL